MRNLQTKDFFKAVRLIRAANLKNEIKAVISEVEDKKKEIKKIREKIEADGITADEIKKTEIPKFSVEDIGFEIMYTVLEKVAEAKVESAFYDFLSGPLEKTVEETECMEITEIFNEFKNADWGEWKKFFSKASDVTSQK